MDDKMQISLELSGLHKERMRGAGAWQVASGGEESYCDSLKMAKLKVLPFA